MVKEKGIIATYLIAQVFKKEGVVLVEYRSHHALCV